MDFIDGFIRFQAVITLMIIFIIVATACLNTLRCIIDRRVEDRLSEVETYQEIDVNGKILKLNKYVRS